MSTVKNLHIHKKTVDKALKESKTNKLKLAVGVTLGALIILGTTLGITVGIPAYHYHQEQQQISVVMQYYGESSTEYKIMKYIDISEKLHSLKLENYSIDESLFQKYNISNELMSPEDIDKLIVELEAFDSNVSNKNITKQSEKIELILTLKKQENLVNNYIYRVGYNVANHNITEATKAYAAEVFGVSEPSDLTFKFHRVESRNEENVVVTQDDKTKYGDERSYNIDDWGLTKEEKQIRAGVSSMVNTDTDDDFNNSDNNSYNEQRNNNIIKALYNSSELEQAVISNDLYNETLANKMK